MKDTKALGKYSASEDAAVAQICNQPCTSAQIQERETDIRALAELTCALKKKVTLFGTFDVLKFVLLLFSVILIQLLDSLFKSKNLN